MKTSIKTLTTICTVIISLNLSAQRSHNGNQPQSQNQPQQPQNNNKNNERYGWGGNHHGHGPWGGNVSIHVGGYPNYYGPNYYGYGYNNYYNVKKAARGSIRQSANVIRQALQFSDWNDIYSPWLAKAIRHQQYAKQLYFWGDYAGALNHAERAGFLAWNTLSYFNNAYGYDDGFAGDDYPNPYSDPNNPYYRKSNPNDSSTQPNTSNNDEDYGYRKSSNETNSDSKKTQQPKTEQKMEKSELDNSLPQGKPSDKELLKTNANDLDID